MGRASKKDPPAIQQLTRLRAQILQLAMQGRLVPQDPADEPASVLFQRIAVERERLIESEEVKRAKPLPPIRPDEVPYEVPHGWTWVRLGELITASDSGWSPPTLGHPRSSDDRWGVLKVSSVTWGEFDPRQHKELPAGVDPRREAEVQPGDWIMSRANTEELVARSVVVDNPPPRLMLSDKHVRLRWTSDTLKKYCNHFNATDTARRYFAEASTGTSSSMKNVTRKAIYRLPVPIPPLAEQQRIVARVDELMAAIDELVSYLRRVEALRARILQLAVRGKLVPQDAGDEPGSQLLERIADAREQLIKAKQIPRPRPVPPVDPDEAPFDLPLEWEWARAGDFVISTDSGWSPRCSGHPAERDEWGVLKTSAVSAGVFAPGENKALPDSLEPRPDLEIRPGDYVMIRASGSKHLVGMGAIASRSNSRLMLSDKHIRVRCFDETTTSYWDIFNRSDVARDYYEAESSGTSTMSNVTRGELSSMLVPVPPIAEQVRIVAAVQNLTASLDELLCDAHRGAPSSAIELAPA